MSYQQPPLRGLLIVRPQTAKLLHGHDFLTKIDSYVISQLGQQKHQTQISKGTGATPSWQDSHSFNVNGEQTIYFTVMDKDKITKDDFIGDATVTLAEVTSRPAYTNTYEIRAKGKPAGNLTISFEWMPEGMGRPVGPGMGMGMGMGMNSGPNFGMGGGVPPQGGFQGQMGPGFPNQQQQGFPNQQQPGFPNQQQPGFNQGPQMPTPPPQQNMGGPSPIFLPAGNSQSQGMMNPPPMPQQNMIPPQPVRQSPSMSHVSMGPPMPILTPTHISQAPGASPMNSGFQQTSFSGAVGALPPGFIQAAPPANYSTVTSTTLNNYASQFAQPAPVQVQPATVLIQQQQVPASPLVVQPRQVIPVTQVAHSPMARPTQVVSSTVIREQQHYTLPSPSPVHHQSTVFTFDNPPLVAPSPTIIHRSVAMSPVHHQSISNSIPVPVATSTLVSTLPGSTTATVIPGETIIHAPITPRVTTTGNSQVVYSETTRTTTRTSYSSSNKL